MVNNGLAHNVAYMGHVKDKQAMLFDNVVWHFNIIQFRPSSIYGFMGSLYS